MKQANEAARRPVIHPLPRGDRGWIKRLSPFLMVHRKRVIIAVAASVIGQVVVALTPIIERSIVDDVLVGHSRPIGPLLALLIGAGVFSFVAAFTRRYVAGRVSFDVSYDLRIAVYDRLQHLDFAYHDGMETGQLVSRASSDVGIMLGLLSVVPIMLGNLVLLVVSLVVMTVLSPALTLVAVLMIPALLVVGLKMRSSIFPATWDAQQRAGEVAGVVDEAVTGVRIVKGFGQERRELAHLAEAGGGLYRSRARLVRLQAKFTPTLSSTPIVGQVAVLAFGGWLALNGHITLGTFLAFSSYLVQMVAPVRMLATTLAVGQQARAGAERLLDIVDQQPAIVERPDAVAAPPMRDEIRFDDVHFHYGAGDVVLDGFELRIRADETVALVGGSGSGKSTAAMLVPRFYDVDSGVVTIDGVDVRDMTFDSLRGQVGVVFEDAFLFSDTVRENIAFARPEASDAEVLAAAEAAQADRFIRALPDGYDTVIGERGLTLSGGQRQRIALARALLTRPAILILDDATSSIDAETEERIHHALRHRTERCTTIVIAHRPSTLRLADRIVVLDGGRVIADGTYAELAAGSDEFNRLFTPRTVEQALDDAARDEDLDALSLPTPSAWPRRDDLHVGHASAPIGLVGAASANRRGGAGGGIHDIGAALSATPQLLAALERLPAAIDDPGIDVASEMDRGPEPFTLRRFVHPFRFALVGGLALVALDTGFLLLGPFFVRRGIDHGVIDHSESALWIASALFLAAAVADWITTRAYTWITGRTAERMLYALRIRIFGQLQRLSLDYYDRELAGRVMTRMTTDVESLSQLVQTGLISAIVSILTCTGVLVFLVVLSPPLALAAASVIPPLVIATLWYRRRSSASYEQARDRIAALNANFQESLAGVRIAQASRREAENVVRFRDVNGEYLEARLESQRLIAVYFPIVLLLADLGAAIVLGTGRNLVLSGTVTTGVVIAFLLYLDQFFSPIQQLSQVFDTWQQAAVSIDRISELMAKRSGTPDSPDAIDPPPLRGEVRLDGVDFHYENTGGIAVLEGLDLVVPAGTSIALVGETGAGKSTVMKLIARFYDPVAGRVTIDGHDIRDFDLAEFRHQLGFVPQEAFLFTGSIRDNIAYGRPAASDADVERAAREVGAHDLIARHTDGYLTSVSERGRSLSAGERQLIALARARLVDPAVLLLDEATSNLDLATEARVQRAMSRVARDRTTILIAHRLPTARTADSIAFVADGVVAEQGTHDELIAMNGRYARLWASFEAQSDVGSDVRSAT